ncbi:Gfo/Idh/MocA family protein [Naasia aerilata]|uniref:Dehydrogenase n=1 Tax=Naasia aerilata TaxID=1162966 RepID=A0ABN6XK73_9MICO|nr:Gfo/Idh/MocA family oxidoreductase [Naasia aerilata]BDZ44538.1 dehydrogenase [Naasia aerilata]
MSRHRVAIVGAGNVSDMHFRGYLEHPDRVDVVAAVDPMPERRAWVEETFGIPTFADIPALVAGADFDVAAVCTPSSVRLEAVGELAAAGKHMHVEKPMADGVEEARRIVQVAEDAGVLLAVDQNFRDHYSFGLARDAIRAGRIGAVRGIDHRELMWREVTGWRAEATHHALSVMGVHWFDGFRYLLDVDADWLVGTAWRSPSMEASGETDAVIHVRFGEVGVNYTQSFSSRFERVETIVLGETGTLAFGYDTLQIADADGVETIDNPCAGPGKPLSAYRSLERLLDAIDEGREPTNSGRDNLKTLSLLDAAYRSAATGETVEFTNGVLA